MNEDNFHTSTCNTTALIDLCYIFLLLYIPKHPDLPSVVKRAVYNNTSMTFTQVTTSSPPAKTVLVYEIAFFMGFVLLHEHLSLL